MRATGLRALVGACLAAAVGLTTGAPVDAATYPAGFSERTLATGLTQPTTTAWTPDGRMLVAEKEGRLKVVGRGSRRPAQLLDISDHVSSSGERGLLGLAVDSAFARNRYVYLLYTYDVDQASPDSSTPTVSRLTRIRLNPDNSVENPTGPERVLLGSYASGACPAPSNTLDCIPSDSSTHSIGTVLSGPDGTLWVGSGDAASPSEVDELAFRTYDETSFAGKILHVDRQGRGLPGHRFCRSDGDLEHACTKLYAKGLRNPFRFKLRPAGGLTVGDVGWRTREEIDLVGAGGASFGWPCYEGIIRTPGYRDRPECTAEYAKEGTPGAHLRPAYDYVHTRTASVLGGPTYTGDDYPDGYRGTVFVGDFTGRFMRRLTTGTGNAVRSARDFASDWSGTDIVATPDGNLAYVDFGTGAQGTGAVREIAYPPGEPGSYRARVEHHPWLASYWRLNDPGRAAADRADGADGSYLGGPVRASGLIAGDPDAARRFDGSDDHVNLRGGMLPTPRSVSVEAWVRLADKSRPQVVVTNAATDFDDGFTLAVNSSGRPLFAVAAGPKRRGRAVSGVSLAPGRAHHVVGTYDGSTARIFVDGVQRGAAAYRGGIAYRSGRDLLFGRPRNPSAANESFEGTLDEVAIYVRAISPTTIRAHRAAGTGG